MKIYFVMTICEKLNLCEYLIYAFLPLPVKWGTDFTFQKNNFEILKKLASIVNISVFFIEISCQSQGLI